MALSRETIWQAADELDQEGISPTLSAVRKRLGTGSFTTIQEAMAERRAKKQAATLPDRDPVPVELIDLASNMAGEVWAIARGMAERRLAGEREGFAEARAELEAQVRETADLAHMLDRENEMLREQLNDLHQLRRDHDELTACYGELRRTSHDENLRLDNRLHTESKMTQVARQAEKDALQRAAHAEGQIDALKEQLASHGAALERRDT